MWRKGSDKYKGFHSFINLLSSVSIFQVDNASGKEVKEIKVLFLQTLKFHGVYKPPKPKPKKQKPGKARKNKPLIKKKTAKVRPAREPTAIKKTKVIKMINVDIKFSNWSVTISLINFFCFRLYTIQLAVNLLVQQQEMIQKPLK